MAQKFLLFGGEEYYSQGGAANLVAAFDDQSSAEAAGEGLRNLDWWHVLSLDDLEIVAECGGGFGSDAFALVSGDQLRQHVTKRGGVIAKVRK